jgi:hypothetical protein
MSIKREEALRSFTRLNCATGHQVYSFKCDENYTMEMAVEDYFKVRNFINQQTTPLSESETIELINDLQVNYFDYDEDEMFDICCKLRDSHIAQANEIKRLKGE